MGRYPNILFHFTGKDALYGILQSNFKLSYAREIILTEHEKMEFAVPMVSFCDLRLSELPKHIADYKPFGIGLSKEWAIRSGLNPVFYVNREAQVVNDLKAGIDVLYGLAFQQDDANEGFRIHQSVTFLMNTYRFIKNYEGTLIREGEPDRPNFRFADEREWRYVPNILEQGFPAFWYVQNDWSKRKKRELNGHVSGHRLHFTPDDIKYLVVERDADILPLVDHLRTVKAKYTTDAINRLTTRILTAEQIKNDV